MTRISGYYVKAAQCCGTRYSVPRYRSINLMSSALWTDGYREGSLMPNDQGLRRCECGDFFLQGELVTISEVEEAGNPQPRHVLAADLPMAIARARSQAVELAARLQLWQHLNHSYRDLYRSHRAAEEVVTQAAWENSNPDQRTIIEKLFKAERKPLYTPAPDRPITFPKFEPSPEQRANMLALLELIDAAGARNAFERVELKRELGRFEEARKNLASATAKDNPNLYRLSQALIEQRRAAPVRYAA